MDVLLINPIDDTAVKNGLGLKIPPLNLMYLAAALENASITVKIIDDDLYQAGFDKITNLASKIDPKVVGITATTATIKNALEYIKNIKKALPNTLTVIGGPHPTFMPYETLKSEKTLDAVVIGEGEETIVDIADNARKNLSGIKGISYRNDDKIRKTPSRPLIKDLDSLPFPARHLVPFKSYELSSQAGGMITSRGCVFSCNYCSSSLIMGKKFRTRSPENVVDELEELSYKYGLKEVAFLDDIFMLNKKRAGMIADEIKCRDIDVSFIASSRVNNVDKRLLESLKDSGMSTLYCGVESGSQRVLDLMGKGITLKQAENAFKIAKNVGIDVVGSFILGYPGETVEEMNQTIDFSIKLDPDYCQYSILTPFPGTPIYYELKHKGLLDTENWDRYTVINSVINYEKLGLSKKLVEKKLARAYLKFYTRPKYVLSHSNMFKVLIKTLFRSYVMPKIRGGTPEGWYNTLESIE
ncbi:B12-binding domain-containing radical SAM protein [Methanobacterium subterraneum]|uniref:B12-binding domain-containing radical SAM protein n=1 Tax=Methanobacterium subterraneum TaxID=59277 RepID=A0A2H4VTH1_9EURY|nr:B12-binding domain-containing radical SAM protein [Methanobacterium subterraneum]